MKYLKRTCPKCQGHVEIPQEIADNPIACPHCAATVQLRPILPAKQPTSLAYKTCAGCIIVPGFFVIGVMLLAGIARLIDGPPSAESQAINQAYFAAKQAVRSQIIDAEFPGGIGDARFSKDPAHPGAIIVEIQVIGHNAFGAKISKWVTVPTKNGATAGVIQ